MYDAHGDEPSIAEAFAEVDELSRMVRELTEVNQALTIENRKLRLKLNRPWWRRA